MRGGGRDSLYNYIYAIFVSLWSMEFLIVVAVVGAVRVGDVFADDQDLRGVGVFLHSRQRR